MSGYEFKVGDLIEIANGNHRFSSYQRQADAMGLVGFLENELMPLAYPIRARIVSMEYDVCGQGFLVYGVMAPGENKYYALLFSNKYGNFKLLEEAPMSDTIDVTTLFTKNADGQRICGATVVEKSKRRNPAGNTQYCIRYADSKQKLGVVAREDIPSLVAALLDVYDRG